MELQSILKVVRTEQAREKKKSGDATDCEVPASMNIDGRHCHGSS